MSVSKRLRFEILRRDEHTCRYCGGKAPDVALTVDHVTPVALGGTDEPSNLVAACRDCNSGKSATPADAAVVADVSADAVRWAEAMKQAAATLSAEVDRRDEYVGQFILAWPKNPSDDLCRSVERFYDLGLPEQLMLDAVSTAAYGSGIYDRESYFAGICWKRIRAMQEIASQIVAGDG